MQIVWIGIIINISRRMLFVVVGEDGLLLVFANVRLWVASAEGA